MIASASSRLQETAVRAKRAISPVILKFFIECKLLKIDIKIDIKISQRQRIVVAGFIDLI